VLSHLFADALAERPESRLVLWTLADKRSHCFSDGQDADAAAATLAAGSDVYYHVGVGRQVEPSVRLCSGDVTGLVCLWADLDLAKEGSAKTYPPDEASVRTILAECMLPPTALIASGGGLQAVWRLAETWWLDAAEREKAASLARRWSLTLAGIARTHGWALDSVHDLARVLRPPGTLNHKYGAARQVSLLESDWARRYTLDDVDEHAVLESTSDGGWVEVDGLVVAPPASLDLPGYLRSAMLKDDLLARTWRGDRPDMVDQTGSAVDLALANCCYRLKFTDQQAADTLILRRHVAGDKPEKALRRKYLVNTLGTAKALYQAPAAVAAAATIPLVGATDNEIDKAKGVLSQLLHRQVSRFIKHGDENSTYSIEFAQPLQVVHLGKATVVMSPMKFEIQCYDAGVHIETPVKQWKTVTRLLLTIAEVISNPSTTMQGESRDWLSDYLTRTPVIPHDQVDAATCSRSPWCDGTWLYVPAEGFRRHVNYWRSQKLESADAHERLRVLGFEPQLYPLADTASAVHTWRMRATEAGKLGWKAMSATV